VLVDGRKVILDAPRLSQYRREPPNCVINLHSTRVSGLSFSNSRGAVQTCFDVAVSVQLPWGVHRELIIANGWKIYHYT